jgi:hypothetical protein
MATSQVYAIDWRDQAERLQNVNAAIFDSYPMGEPMADHFYVEGKGAFTLIPDIDPQVGSKSEDVPSPPFHMIPVLQVGYVVGCAGVCFGVSGWGGYLPSGGESLIGLDAKLTQSLFGAGGSMIINAGRTKVSIPVGYQQINAHVTGAITEKDVDDDFKVDTSVVFVAPSVSFESGLWTSLLVAKKQTNSEFHIEIDETVAKLEDDLSDVPLPVTIQASLGWIHKETGIGLAAGQLLVPDRFVAPRFQLSYRFTL